MLYLRSLLKYIKTNFFFYTSFVLITCLFFFSIIQQSWIKKNFNTYLFPVEGRYFHLVLKGERDYSFLKQKVEDLPGITNVEIVDSSYIGSRAKMLMEELDLELPKEVKKIQYTGMTVYMEQDLGNKNLNLLKEYLGRIVGKDNLTTTSIIKNAKDKKSNNLLEVFKNAPHLVLVIILAIIWNLMFFIFLTRFKLYSSLVEKFQRKSGITYSGILITLGTPFVLVTCLSTLISNIRLYEISILAGTILFLTYFVTKIKRLA